MEAGMEDRSEGVPAAVEEVKQRAASGAEARKEGARERAERLGAGVGEHAANIARAVRSAGDSVRGKEDWLADAADALGRNLERFSASAREKGFDSVRRDVERLARERPALFMGAAVTAGLALGRLLRSTQSGPEEKRRGEFDHAAGTGEAPGYVGATSEPGASRPTDGPTAPPVFASPETTQPDGGRYGEK